MEIFRLKSIENSSSVFFQYPQFPQNKPIDTFSSFFFFEGRKGEIKLLILSLFKKMNRFTEITFQVVIVVVDS